MEVVSSLVDEAVALLRLGQVIGFPTETVYGLAADASNCDAISNVFTLKNRPLNHPLIVHIADAAALSAWAIHIPRVAYALCEAFWPGPLTLVLRKAPDVSNIITGGQDTIALRCPAHPLALAILRELGRGICAPSANRFGQLSPTSAAHVFATFGFEIPLIVDGGDCVVGIESTIVDLTDETPRLLRAGMLTSDQIKQVTGVLWLPEDNHTERLLPRVSGSHRSHYAPRTPLLLGSIEQLKQYYTSAHNSVWMSFQDLPDLALYQKIIMPSDPVLYAKDLYAALHRADTLSCNAILCELPPITESWRGIHDRLARAASTGFSKR